MFNEEQAKALLNKVLKLSPARATEVCLTFCDIAATRFANNRITENCSERNLEISIRIVRDKRMGRATTNSADSDALSACCETAMFFAKHAAHDPDVLPLGGRQKYYAVNSYFDATRSLSARTRGERVTNLIRAADQRQQQVAGIHKVTVTASAIGNSQGLFAFHRGSNAVLSVTARQDEYSGLAITSEADITRLNYPEVTERAFQKASCQQPWHEVPAGEYTVILEPLAVLNLLSLLIVDYISQISHFSGTAVHNQQGFVAGHLGSQLFGDLFTLDDDVYHPLLQGRPFDDEGVPKMPVILVYKGTPSQLVHSRASALQMSEDATGHGLHLPNPYGAVPQHLIMHGGEKSLDDLIKQTSKGLLITRFWYNRIVDPTRLVVTGITRDGTFWIENGEIVAPVRNLRFNESLFNIFSHITMLGKEKRTYDDESGQLMVVPSVRIDGFRFSGRARD